MALAVELDLSPEDAMRSTLRRAVHTRKVPELRSVIKDAEAAGSMYDVEIRNARRAMELQREWDCRDLLAEAKAVHSYGLMQAAVAEANEVGLPAEELQQALVDLEHEARRDAAKEQIKAVTVGAATYDELREAMLEGERAGLDDIDLEQVRVLLELQETVAAARTSLQAALRSRDIGALREALALGAERGLPDWELFDGEEALAEEEQKVAVRAQLKDAVLKKHRPALDQIAALQEAIQEAYGCGLDRDSIEKAKWYMENLEGQHAARQAVAKAVGTQRFDDLKAAVNGGMQAGLDLKELAEARRLLAESYKPAAREKLRLAVASRDMEELRAALAHGEAMGISEVGLADARGTLMEEERKVEARRRLHALVGDGSLPEHWPLPADAPEGAPGMRIGDLRAAVKFAEVSGVLEADLAVGRRILRVEERRRRARAALRRAVNEELTLELGPAIEEADAAGLAAEEVDPARALVDRLRKDAARAGLAGLVASKDIDALRLAIQACEQAGLEEHELTEARGTLAGEERKAAARLAVAAALASLIPDELRAAVAEGEGAGLGYVELRPAREALTVEQARKDAQDVLTKLMDLLAVPHDPPGCRAHKDLVDRLRSAIRKAGGVKLGAEALAAPRAVLAAEDSAQAARDAIAEALAGGQVAAMEAAIQGGRAAGLLPSEVAPAEAALAAKLTSLAQEALEKAMRNKVVEDLRLAIKAGLKAHVPEPEILMARQLLAEEHLQRAIGQRCVHELEAAIEYAREWLADTPTLDQAEACLARERRKAAARSALRQAALQRGELGQLMAALSEGHAAGLEDWEFVAARKALREESLRVA